MTVVLLDALRTGVVPIAALAELNGPVRCTAEVPAETRSQLREDASADVLVSTNAGDAEVVRRVAAGEKVIAAEPILGDALVSVADVMNRLWGFGAWETRQTHESLTGYLLEEAYELLDAIEHSDSEHIREELGDLLLQVLFHSRIAEAQGRFAVDDVANALETKLRHRSPHLDRGALDSIAEQEDAWNRRKASEKARESCLDGIALQLPSLALAQKVVARCIEAGVPVDCIPAALQTDISELELRAKVVRFMAAVRDVEAKSGSEPSAQAWRTGLGKLAL